MSAPSPIILWILYIMSLFIQAFCAFHLLTVGSSHFQEVGSDVIITIVVLGFVVGLSRLAGLAGLVDVVGFLIELSRHSIALLILIVMVTRFLKITQLVLLNLSFSENVRDL